MAKWMDRVINIWKERLKDELTDSWIDGLRVYTFTYFNRLLLMIYSNYIVRWIDRKIEIFIN